MNTNVNAIARGAGVIALAALAFTACTPGQRARAARVKPAAPKPAASTTTTTRPRCAGDVVIVASFDGGMKCDVRPPQRLDVVMPAFDDALWREGFGQDCSLRGGIVTAPGVCEGIDY